MIVKINKLTPYILLISLLLAEFFLFFNKKPNQDYGYLNFGLNLDSAGGKQHTYFGNTINSQYHFYNSGLENLKIYIGQPFVYTINVNKKPIGSIFGVGYIKHHSTYMLDQKKSYLDISNYLERGSNQIDISITIDCFCGEENAFVIFVNNNTVLNFEKFKLK